LRAPVSIRIQKRAKFGFDESKPMLRQVDQDLWMMQHPLRFLGAEVGTRMTVLRLKDGSLLIHSPVSLDLTTQAELDRLGPVRFVVAPNRYHHLFVAEYARIYPQAKIFGAPGLDSKRKDLRFDVILSQAAPTEWASEIDQTIFRAFPPLNEVVFFHRSSRTVLFTDLLINIRTSESPYTRFLMWLDGGLGQVAVPRSFRLLLKMRRARARETIDKILSWEFDRLSLAHGEVVERGAKEIVRAAWSFL
jgi:hypothetical protein